MLTLKRKVTYIIVAALLLLIAIYVSAYLIGKYYINHRNIKATIISVAEKKLNRKVSLSDQIHFHITWKLTPYFEFFDVTISNIGDGSKPNMITAKSLEIQLDLAKLLEKDVRILALKLHKPTIYLESNNKINNWDFSAAQTTATSKDIAPAAESDPEYKVSINDIYVNDGIITYINNGKTSSELTIKKMHIESNTGRDEFDISLLGTYNKLNLEIEAAVDTLNTEQIVFKLSKLKAGDSQLKGQLELRKNPLHLSGKFTSPHFATSDFANSNSSNSDEYSIPDIQIPISYLNGSSIDFALEIKQLVLGKLPFSNVNIKMTTSNNTVQIGLKPPVDLADGKLSADVNFDSKPSVPVFNFKISAKPLKLEKIFSTIMGKSPITGSTLDLSINLNSTGNNLRDIVGNLSGKILATASAGQYVNSSASIANAFANIISAMITFKKTELNTAFSCAVVNFNVKNGIASANDGIGLESSYANVLGSGNLDLRNGRINFKITPQQVGNATIDLTSFSIAQIITVNGTISNPQVSLDPIDILSSKTAQTAIEVGLLGQFAIPAELANMAFNKGNNNTNNSANPCQVALNR